MQVQGVNPAVKGNIRLKSWIGVWTKQLSFSRGLILSRSSSVLWQPLGSLLLLCLLICLQSILELPLSLLAGFCLTFTFIDKPTQNLNCVGLPLFGIVFTLCISCILANLFQILLGFNFDLTIGPWIKKLNQPLVLVTVVSGIQVAVSVSCWSSTHPLLKRSKWAKLSCTSVRWRPLGTFGFSHVSLQWLLGPYLFPFCIQG